MLSCESRTDESVHMIEAESRLSALFRLRLASYHSVRAFTIKITEDGRNLKDLGGIDG